jgi:hypothetical protein
MALATILCKTFLLRCSTTVGQAETHLRVVVPIEEEEEEEVIYGLPFVIFNSSVTLEFKFQLLHSKGGRSGNRTPVGALLSVPIQTGPEPHTHSCIIGTGSFPGVKNPGRGVNHPPTHLAPRLRKE